MTVSHHLIYLSLVIALVVSGFTAGIVFVDRGAPTCVVTSPLAAASYGEDWGSQRAPASETDVKPALFRTQPSPHQAPGATSMPDDYFHLALGAAAASGVYIELDGRLDKLTNRVIAIEQKLDITPPAEE